MSDDIVERLSKVWFNDPAVNDDNVSVRDEFTEMVNNRIALLRETLVVEQKTNELLRTRIAGLEADARRYRFLRGYQRRWEIREWTGVFWDLHHETKLDAAIDAALPNTEIPK